MNEYHQLRLDNFIKEFRKQYEEGEMVFDENNLNKHVFMPF